MEWQFISGEWTGDKKNKKNKQNPHTKCIESGLRNTKPVRIGENEAVFGLKKSGTGR